MQYKTIMLAFLQDRPALHERLRQNRMVLKTVEALATELKNRHESWKEQISRAKPGSHPSQLATEALEMALSEMESHLPSESPDEAEPISLETAMAFIRLHTPPE